MTPHRNRRRPRRRPPPSLPHPRPPGRSRPAPTSRIAQPAPRWSPSRQARSRWGTIQATPARSRRMRSPSARRSRSAATKSPCRNGTRARPPAPARRSSSGQARARTRRCATSAGTTPSSTSSGWPRPAASLIAFPPRPSGSSRHVVVRPRATGGVSRWRRARPTARSAANPGRRTRRRMSAVSLPILTVCTTPAAACGNGSPTAGTTITRAPGRWPGLGRAGLPGARYPRRFVARRRVVHGRVHAL
jgi:hypothetical protein